ncbi:hypothetical protein BG015_004312, partial [Linnemannia schmuckeri]
MLLTRILLRQAPLGDVTDLLRAVCFTKQSFDDDFDLWPTAPSEVSYMPVLHYLSHVAHLPTSMFPDTGPNNNPRLVAYLKTTGFFEHCGTLDMNASFPQNLSSHNVGAVLPMLLQEFHRQLLWALCVPESTRALQLLVSDSHRFLDRVARFKLLDSLRISIGSGAQTNAILARIPPFFHRCCALKTIYAVLFGNDPFKWAVEERREHDAQLARSRSDTPTLSSSLVPVKIVILQFGGQIRGQPIDSIARGFGTTLESYSIAGWHMFGPHQHEPVVFGQGWNLPRLHTLTATTSEGRLTLRPDTLAGCPAVKKVTLQDSKPAQLPQLTTLSLSGTPARLFHPDTLHSTVKLDMLTLAQAYENLHWREYKYNSIEAGYIEDGEDEGGEHDDEQVAPFALHPEIGHLLPVLSEQQTET